MDAACRLFPSKSARHKFRGWMCLGVGIGIQAATERSWIFPVAEISPVRIDADAFIRENFPVGHRVVKRRALAFLNAPHLLIDGELRVKDDVSVFVFTPTMEVKSVVGAENWFAVGSKHFFWVEKFGVGVRHCCQFIGADVLSVK